MTVPPTVLLLLLIKMPLLSLRMVFVPVTSVPIKLPCTTLPTELEPAMEMPVLLPEMMLRDAALVPPIRLFGESMMSTPARAFPRSLVPVRSVPK